MISKADAGTLDYVLEKEKPKFEIRPLHSIREELELIKEFCWQPKLAAGKIYTVEEIDAVERRLNVKLPPGGTDSFLHRLLPAKETGQNMESPSKNGGVAGSHLVKGRAYTGGAVRMMRYSQGKSRNYKKAIYWYTKTSKLGCQSSAEHKIGWCYEKLGDFNRAVEWYIKGQKRALAIRPITLQNCMKLEQVYLNLKKAIEWYRVSAKLGFPNAELWRKENGYSSTQPSIGTI